MKIQDMLTMDFDNLCNLLKFIFGELFQKYFKTTAAIFYHKETH